jgi:shikimate dehydrogenase
MVKNATKEAVVSGGTNFVYKNKGYSFDGKGLLIAIKQAGLPINGKSVLICGTGGAGRSIALELLKRGAIVYLQNRTKQTALDFIHSFKGKKAPKYYNGEPCDLLINATSVTDESVFNKEQVENASLVIDINYGKRLALQDLTKECKVRFLNGLEMLFYQAYYADCIIAKQKFEESKAIKCYLNFKVKYENSSCQRS